MTDTTGHIKTGLHERMKRHCIVDAYERPTHIYEAPADATNGKPCLLTRLQYSGTTTVITGSIEEDSTWNSAWDF